MVHELVVPLAHAGPEIDGHDALGEQIVSGTMAAVVIGGRRLDRKVDQAGVFVDADLRPDAGVAVEGPRVFFPRLVPELARPWNGVERPDAFTGPRVERTNKALGVVVRDDRRTLAHRGADDDEIARDARRRVHANFTALEVDLLVG